MSKVKAVTVSDRWEEYCQLAYPDGMGARQYEHCRATFYAAFFDAINTVGEITTQCKTHEEIGNRVTALLDECMGFAEAETVRRMVADGESPEVAAVKTKAMMAMADSEVYGVVN